MNKKIKINECSENCSCCEKEPVIDFNSILDSKLLYSKYLKILFKNSSGQKMCLYVPKDVFQKWLSSHKGGNVLSSFMSDFFSNNNQVNEIVDEFGDLIGDKDMGNNSTNTMVGKSKFGSDKAIRQSIAKVKSYDANLGRGMITW